MDQDSAAGAAGAALAAAAVMALGVGSPGTYMPAVTGELVLADGGDRACRRLDRADDDRVYGAAGADRGAWCPACPCTCSSPGREAASVRVHR